MKICIRLTRLKLRESSNICFKFVNLLLVGKNTKTLSINSLLS
ncbi:unnamed protein product [Chironomus riparius]|uniref:Uncharacterized protein n=1 Tax=Chironomus riparius TaxID=315576 RepID=A0A9N9RMT8_9DIPT|nr:unnamed protein product [Chironomus riparius]